LSDPGRNRTARIWASDLGPQTPLARLAQNVGLTAWSTSGGGSQYGARPSARVRPTGPSASGALTSVWDGPPRRARRGSGCRRRARRPRPIRAGERRVGRLRLLRLLWGGCTGGPRGRAAHGRASTTGRGVGGEEGPLEGVGPAEVVPRGRGRTCQSHSASSRHDDQDGDVEQRRPWREPHASHAHHATSGRRTLACGSRSQRSSVAIRARKTTESGLSRGKGKVAGRWCTRAPGGFRRQSSSSAKREASRVALLALDAVARTCDVGDHRVGQPAQQLRLVVVVDHAARLHAYGRGAPRAAR